MPRFKLTIEYDGTPFVGWQRQANGESVQGVIESAFARIGETASLRGAGRTDAGVHALAQVAHVDLVRNWRPDVLRDALNAHMRPAPVAILAASAVPDGFDARFSAKARHYLYRILARRSPATIDFGRVWQVSQPLDPEAMAAGALHLLGYHDFTTFRAAECQAKSPMKTLDRFDLAVEGEQILVRASARSFLHSQVRSMVGTLVRVGSGAWPPERVAAALEARDRAACGPVAPACGLYLSGVDYDSP